MFFFCFGIFKDLNRVINKPLVPPVEDGNRPDYVNIFIEFII
jgi:hypothetical protein